LNPPRSRMDILTDAEISKITGNSKLVAKYNENQDSESAHEILTRKLEEAEKATAATKTKTTPKRAPKEKDIFDNPVVRQAGRTAASVITRTVLGVLFGSRRR
jgi:uncharacterized protein